MNCISCGSVIGIEENVQACTHGYLCESCKTCPLCFYANMPLDKYGESEHDDLDIPLA